MENSLGNKSSAKAKPFFKRPEGQLGKVFLVLALIAGAYGLYQILPWIITLLANTLYAILLFCAVAFVIFLITNRKIRSLVSLGFKMIMRALTSFVVELNPIAILRIHIENLVNRREEMKEYIAKLKGQIRKMERKLSDNRTDIEKSMTFAKHAMEKGTDLAKKQAWSKTRQAKRRQESSMKFSDLLKKMIKIDKILILMHENLGIFIEDLTDEVDWREEEYKTIKLAHGALKASESILQGSPDDRAMFELALEKLEEDVSDKLGNMDMILDMSEGFLETMDIEKGVMAEEGMLMVEEFESGALDSFFNEFDPKTAKNNMDANRKAQFDKDVKEMKTTSTFSTIQKEKPKGGKYF